VAKVDRVFAGELGPARP